MSFLSDIYHKSLSENEKSIRFWENYLQNLKLLDFDVFSNKLKVPVLVPVGSRILFRGELKHTNEVVVALGADYFAKCSLQQAEVLRQHRITDAQSKLEHYFKEKEYLENQVSFTKHNVLQEVGQEIIEVCTDQEDKAWRKKHRENMRKYKQSQSKGQSPNEEKTDEELWNRLEELELQEELQSMNEDTAPDDKSNKETFIVNENNIIPTVQIEQNSNENFESISSIKIEENSIGSKFKPPTQTSKLDLLQEVIDKQNELEQKLEELKNKNRNESKTEEDLMFRLNEMEQLDDLEDEMNRLDDILEGDNENLEDDSNREDKKNGRKVSFASEDEDTIELTFTHTNTESSKEPYTPEKGILKPSDIYDAYPNLFNNGTTSILKKSKYNNNSNITQIINVKEPKDSVEVPNKTIIVKDIVEKVSNEDCKGDNIKSRPVSIFKKTRQAKKS